MNNHATVARRITRGDLSTALKMMLGTCPTCAMFKSPPMPGLAAGAFEARIYRLSHRSITFRHDACGMQWTVTLATLHRVASKQAERPNAHAWCKALADWSKDAAERETRGKRKRS